MRLGFDIEANGLLDSTTIDYKAVPYKLKPMFRVWCAAAIDIDTGITYKFVGEEEIRDGLINLLRKATLIFGHNIVDYDLLVLRLYTGVEYTIGDTCTFDGKPVEIVDTLVLSKTLNPDRYGGHSLDEWGQRLGLEKINWRQRAIELGLIAYNAPKGAEFQQYHPEMLEYNVRDVQVNVKLYHALMEEWGDWPWDDAFKLEMRTRDVVTRQSHRGFWFDRKLAERNIDELDELMDGIRQVVEPHLPPKPLGITKAKVFMPPKIQFKKNGEISAVMLKFIEKHDGIYTVVDGKYTATFYGENKVWTLPMDTEVPIRSHEPATVKDTTHIKGWLVEMGWRPTMYKERDLTCDAKKKKLSREKFEEVVERYVEQTLESPFCRDRCEELSTRPSRLREKLLKHDIKRPLKVYTNPTFTVGMEKEIDPELEKLAETFPHVGLISKYLTYAHRRNSILGGGFDPDDIDEDDEFAGKGFLSAERILEDGRIPTPADSCGAGTSRFKHRLVANVPRVTSLYGKNMRGMFGTDQDEGCIQLGYDFDSLEAKIEAHYVYRYPGGPEYGVSLTAEKPADCHSVLAAKISDIIGKPFPRSTAKNVKYGCLPVDNVEVLTRDGWRGYNEVHVGDHVFGWNAATGGMCLTEVTGKHFYPDADVGMLGNLRWSVESTEDHRWLAKSGYGGKDVSLEYAFDLNTASSILNAAPYTLGENNCKFAGVVGWLLSDGHWKWSEAEPCKQNRYGEKLGVIASIGQSEKKFAEDVKRSLEEAGLQFTTYTNGDMLEFRIDAEAFRGLARAVGFYGKGKLDFDWQAYVLNLTKSALTSFVRCFNLADGRTVMPGAIEIRQRPGAIADAVALALFLLGRKTTLRVDNEGMATIRGSATAWTGFQTGSWRPTRKVDVFCLSTVSESFVIRQGGVITLTGNCSYNAQPPRVAKTVGCDEATGKIIFDAFWENAAPLRDLKEAMQAYWETTGEKKFLLGIDKRKLPIRAKGNVINTAFQSAGVICAKRAMVLHDDYLRKEGLIVDFFKDDWRQKDYCQQLIAYHDESQLEIKRSMVTWKKFASEEECKAFKDPSGKVWSDPVHNDKGWFRGYCRAGELATIAVQEAGRYYKLNVNLSAGYMLGRNWAECH